jgi:hypothetical protein
MNADKEWIRIGFDPERLPKRADGSCVLEGKKTRSDA